MKYIITTDGGTTYLTAANLRRALLLAGIPATTAAEFEQWLESDGSYGSITEDGVVIARVSSEVVL